MASARRSPRQDASQMVYKLLKGTSATPADNAFSHFVKLMRNYVKCSDDKRPDDISLLELLQQICAAIKTHLDDRSTLRLHSMKSVSNEEFVKLEGVQVCGSFLRCVMQKSIPFAEEERNKGHAPDDGHLALMFLARFSLYRLLVTMTDTCDTEIIKATRECRIISQLNDDLHKYHRDGRYNFEIFRAAGADKLNQVGPIIGLSLLENCVSAGMDENGTIQSTLIRYVDSDQNEIVVVILALSLMHIISPHNPLHKNLYTIAVFRGVAKYLKGAVPDPLYGRFRFPTEEAVNPVFGIHQRINLTSLLNCLLTLVNSDDYKCNTIQSLRTYVPKLDEILKEGSDDEKDQLKHLLRKLCQHSCSKCSWSYLGDLLLKHGIIPNQNSGAGSHTPPPDYEAALMQSGKYRCHYMQLCHNFLKQLDAEENILDQFMDQEFHRCFCNACMDSRKDSDVYERGRPPKKYALPRGWTKFALKVPPRAARWKMFEDWNMAFYGTKREELLEIFRKGNLQMTEDTANPIIVSPSIVYGAGKTEVSRHTDARTGKSFCGQVAFQVRIRPDTYEILPAKGPGNEKKMDHNFSNEELVWQTKYKYNNFIMIVGILVRAQEDTAKK